MFGPAIVRAIARGAMIAAVSGWLVTIAEAHPEVQNSLDVVVGPERIEVDARITVEEIALVDNGGNGPSNNSQWHAAVARHAEYVRRHVHVLADGRGLSGTAPIVDPQAGLNPAANGSAGGIAAGGDSNDDDSAAEATVRYHLTYSLAAPLRQIEIRHSFLQEFGRWNASCVVRVRQADRTDFSMSLVERDELAKFVCDWSAAKQLTGDRPTADSTEIAGGRSHRRAILGDVSGLCWSRDRTHSHRLRPSAVRRGVGAGGRAIVGSRQDRVGIHASPHVDAGPFGVQCRDAPRVDRRADDRGQHCIRGGAEHFLARAEHRPVAVGDRFWFWIVSTGWVSPAG